MKRSRFAARLSWEIIIFTSLIFLVAINIVSIRGVKLTQTSSMDLTAQILKTSVNKFESVIKSTEQAGNTLARTLESSNRAGVLADTAICFRFLKNSIIDCPYILGAGLFFEPGYFNKDKERAGMFVNRDMDTGLYYNEWDDNQTSDEDGWDYFDTDWYVTAKAAGTTQWIPPYYEYTYFGDYEFITTYAAPVINGSGDVIAVCDIDLSLDWIKDELLSMRPYEHSNIILTDGFGNFICNPLSDKPNEGNLRDSDYLGGLEIKDDGIGRWKWEDYDDLRSISFRVGKSWLYCVKTSLSNGWQMISVNYYDEAVDALSKILLLVIITVLLGLVFLFFAIRSVIHYETHPISEFALAAGRITGGRFDVPIPEVKHKDEFSELGSALSYMQTSVTNYISELERTTSEKERLASELDVARKIQMQMLSKHFPTIEGCGIFATSVPARQVGGDLYDFYVKGDDVFYIVGDVSGKGVPAALLMSISISAFRAAIRNDHTMADIANVVNNVFCRSNEDNMFITLNVGRINLKTGEFEVCNAGHNPLVLISPDGSASFLHLKSNVACGVMPDFPYQGDVMTLEKGSRLLIYSDGVTEAEDSSHNQYGEDRLLEFAGKNAVSAEPSDEKVIAGLSESVSAFVDGAEQFDDMTMMSISI